MPKFEFSDERSLADNVESFLASLEEGDPEMTAILRMAMPELMNVTDDASRHAARIRFNGIVAAALDDLASQEDLAE